MLSCSYLSSFTKLFSLKIPWWTLVTLIEPPAINGTEDKQAAAHFIVE